MQALMKAERGLIVVGELKTGAESVAALQIARLLGWPIAVDVMSGESQSAQATYHASPIRHQDC